MAEPRKPADRARKQVKAKFTAGDHVPVEIKGKIGEAEVTVLPVSEWGFAWRSHLARDQALELIEDIVDPDDLDAFMEVHPRITDIFAFFDAYAGLVGEELGESQTSQAS